MAAAAADSAAGAPVASADAVDLLAPLGAGALGAAAAKPQRSWELALEVDARASAVVAFIACIFAVCAVAGAIVTGRKRLRVVGIRSSEALASFQQQLEAAARSGWWRLAPPRNFQVIGLTCSAASISYWSRSVLSVVVIALAEELELDSVATAKALSAFFYGYVVSNIACVALVQKFNPRQLMFTAVVGPSVATLVLPKCVDLWGLSGLMVCRVASGFLQGMLYPSIISIFGDEFRQDEAMRTRAMSVLGGMAPLGISVNLLVSPLLMQRSNWEETIKVAGLLGLPWALMCQLVPDRRRGERLKLQEETLSDDSATISAFGAGLAVVRVLPFWGIAAGCFAHNWMNYIVMSWLPMYLQEHLSVTGNALSMSCLPYIATALASPTLGSTATYLQRRGVDLWKLRRGLALVGLLVPALGMLIFPRVPARLWPLPLLVVGLSLMCSTLTSVSVMASPLDIAGPNTSGVVYAIANTIGSIPGFWGVRVAGELRDCCGWPSMFGSCTVLYVIASGLYVRVGTAKRIFD